MADRASLEDVAKPSPSGQPPHLLTQDFDYPLDESLIAQRPLPRRDASRLLLIRRTETSFEDRGFIDLPSLFAPGDALVLNDTLVFPARLLGHKPTGAAAEILLIEALDPDELRWRALVRPGGKLKPGRRVRVSDELELVVEDSAEGGSRIVRLVTSLSPAACRCHLTSGAKTTRTIASATKRSTPESAAAWRRPPPGCTSQMRCWTQSPDPASRS
jgi:S-adenosylmethionine:tRNA-ribosyltransferase-isomerase (queuine synthetase)